MEELRIEHDTVSKHLDDPPILTPPQKKDMKSHQVYAVSHQQIHMTINARKKLNNQYNVRK